MYCFYCNRIINGCICLLPKSGDMDSRPFWLDNLLPVEPRGAYWCESERLRAEKVCSDDD